MARRISLYVRLLLVVLSSSALLTLYIGSRLPFAYVQIGPAGTTYTTTLTVIGRAGAPDPAWRCSSGRRFNDCVWR